MKMPAHEESVVRENFNWIFLYVLINEMAPRIPAQKILDALYLWKENYMACVLLLMTCSNNSILSSTEQNSS